MNKYFIYCRKSSEEEERQALSIESQLQELREYAYKNNLEIVKEFVESKSAKTPGRKIFNEMLREIEAGKADGIVAWQPDRLSRNSVDGGKIIYLIDQGVIKDLKFPSYYFEKSPHGKFNLSIAFGFSKMYVDRLVEDVKRGIREKVRRGEFPGKAPLGYFNHPKTRTIEPDPELFDTVKHFLEKFAEGTTSLSQLKQETFEAGIKRETGLPLTFCGLKHVLENPFYYGVFRLKGEIHQGLHKPMISKENFDKIQKILNKNPRKLNRTKKKRDEKNFLFSGLAKCGECGFAITHEWHKKKSGLVFKYYRCTYKSRTHSCSQRLYLREENLADQVKNTLSAVALCDEWRDKFIDKIKSWKEDERHSSQQELESCKQEEGLIKDKLGRLLDLQLEGDLSKPEYKEKKNALMNQKSNLEEKIKKISEEGSIWFEPTLDFVKAINQVHHAIKNENFKEMNEILKKLSLNSTIQNKKLHIEFKRPFSFLSELRMKEPSAEGCTKLSPTSDQACEAETQLTTKESRNGGSSLGSFSLKAFPENRIHKNIKQSVKADVRKIQPVNEKLDATKLHPCHFLNENHPLKENCRSTDETLKIASSLAFTGGGWGYRERSRRRPTEEGTPDNKRDTAEAKNIVIGTDCALRDDSEISSDEWWTLMDLNH